MTNTLNISLVSPDALELIKTLRAIADSVYHLLEVIGKILGGSFDILTLMDRAGAASRILFGINSIEKNSQKLQQHHKDQAVAIIHQVCTARGW